MDETNFGQRVMEMLRSQNEMLTQSREEGKRNAHDIQRILQTVEGSPPLAAILATYEGQINTTREVLAEGKAHLREVAADVRDNDKRLDELEAWRREVDTRGSYRDRDLGRVEEAGGRDLRERVHRGEVGAATINVRVALIWAVASAVGAAILGWWIKGG